MSLKIKSRAISRALRGIKDLSKLDEIQINKIRTLSISGRLTGRRKKVFEREINEVLKYLTNLKKFEVRAKVKKGDYLNIDISLLNKENIKWLTLNNVDLSKTDFTEMLKDNHIIEYINLGNCNIRDVSFLKQIQGIEIYIRLENNPIAKKFAKDILRISQKTGCINIYNCEEILAEYEEAEKEGIEIPRFLFW